MRYVHRQGARVAYEVTGEGPAIVLGHSFLCDGRMWEAVVPALARHSKVINVDVRGHRASTAPSPFTLDDLAGDWRAILDQEGVDRAVLCGLSMGAMTAMRLALASPDRVRGLVLLDTSAEPQLPHERIKYRILGEALRAFGKLEFTFRMAGDALFGATTRRERPELVRREIGRLRQKDMRQIYHASRAVFDRGDILPRLSELRCPTRVVVGEEDVATRPDCSERIAAAIPGATLAILRRVGHLSAIEAPEAVVREIETLLEAC